MRRLLFGFLLLLSIPAFSFQPSAPEPDSTQYVILVSFDGFRYDYAQKYQAKNLLKMAEEGVRAKAMIPSFPSKTFPNHYTLVTGLYPGHHGLVDNNYYDPSRQTIYRMHDREKVEDPYYYGGTPLWQLAQQQGLKTASYFWVGSETPIQGEFPTYYYKYDGDVPNKKRINQVINWLELPAADRPRFISLYFSLVDSEGHHSGPESAQLEATVLEADQLVRKLMKEVEKLSLNVNVIITSDHGMQLMHGKPETYISLSGLIQQLGDKVVVMNNGTHCHMYAKTKEDISNLYDLTTASMQNKPVTVLRKKDMPEEWHYAKSDRVGDILITANTGHYLTEKTIQSVARMQNDWGTHGFNPYNTPAMGAIFYAKGPAFKNGLVIEPFENVHVYPLITEILGLTNPEDIDGKAAVLQPILK